MSHFQNMATPYFREKYQQLKWSINFMYKFNMLKTGICGYEDVSVFSNNIFASLQGTIMRDGSA